MQPVLYDDSDENPRSKLPSADVMRNLGALIDSEIGGQPMLPEVADVMTFMWPECEEGPDGRVIMNDPDDVRRLELLCRLFGMPMRVEDNSLAVLGRAYDVFARGLLPHVWHESSSPGQCPIVRQWPEVWQDYIRAVACVDYAEARRCARVIQPLSPDCEFPHLSGVPKPGQ